MKPLLQTLPSLQNWIHDLEYTANSDEIQNLLGHIEQWIQRAKEEFNKEQLTGTVPLLLGEAAVELFNISVCKSESLSVLAKAKARSAACGLLDISSSNKAFDNNDTWLRIHYFASAAWHEAQEFDEAENFLERACNDGNMTVPKCNMSPEIRELVFNILCLRSDNYWAMDNELEAKKMAIKAVDYLDKNAALWLHLKLYNKGVKLYQASLMEKAEDWFRMSLEALKTGECHPQAILKRNRTLLVLALTLKSTDKCEEALQTISLSLQYGNKDVDCLYLKTELLIKLKKFDEASETLLQTIRHAGCGQKMGSGLCQLLKEAGQLQMCMSGIDELILKYPESAKLKLQKLRCLLSADDIENGALLADQVLNDHVSGRRELSEKDIDEFRSILNSIALNLFEIRLFGSCSEWIVRSERLAVVGGNSDEKSIYLCRCAMAIVEIEQGNTKEALHCALKADHLCPRSSLAKLVAAHCFLLLNDPESAKKQLNDAFQLQDLDRKYVSIILSLSSKAEFTDCAAICIEELVNSQEIIMDKITLLKCAVELHYKTALEALQRSDEDEKIFNDSLDRLCQHFKSIVHCFQSRMLEASTDSDTLERNKQDVGWFGKVAWNSGILASKKNLFLICSNLFHFSVVLFQMALGSKPNDFNCQILIGLCMSATTAMRHISSMSKTSQGPRSGLEDLCNFCVGRIREFHVIAKAFPNDKLLCNLYPIIHIVDMELKLTVGDPNIEIHVRNSVSIPGWKSSLFEEMASICLKAPFFKRNVAIVALQMLLTTEIEQSQQDKATLNIEHVSRTIRHMITLTDNADNQLPFFEQAKTVCLNIASTSLTYPKLEAQWLVSRSWNNGVMAYRSGSWKNAKIWMSTSIELLSMLGDSCSANKQEMVRCLAFVLSRIQEQSNIAN